MDIYYHMGSVGLNLEAALLGFRFRVSQVDAVRLLAGVVVMQKLDRGWKVHLQGGTTWPLTGGLSSRPQEGLSIGLVDSHQQLASPRASDSRE